MNETKKEDTELNRSINVKVQFDENRTYNLIWDRNQVFGKTENPSFKM